MNPLNTKLSTLNIHLKSRLFNYFFILKHNFYFLFFMSVSFGIMSEIFRIKSIKSKKQKKHQITNLTFHFFYKKKVTYFG